MGPEINIDSIRAFEKQIEQGAGDVIQLRRARNSLLNISTRVPPEVLGYIFRWNITPEGDFGGLRIGSYNFLLVCHHWFKVASRTPELWSFWGNTLRQWSQRYQRSGTAPLDLVLSQYHDMGGTKDIHFDEPLRDALRDRAARDTIRCIHLEGWDTDLLRSIVSSLTPGGEGIRYSSVESVIITDDDLDISDFLTHHHFPKLRHLRLFATTKISIWDHLVAHSAALTTLSLVVGGLSTAPTTSQLLSILASNPQLRSLGLSRSMIPHDDGGGSKLRVPLHHLKNLYLNGDFHPVLRLLDRLDHPVTMDQIGVTVFDCTAEEISGILGPCLQDYIRRDHRFQNALGILASSSPYSISVDGIIITDANGPTLSLTRRPPSLTFGAMPKDQLTPEALDKLSTDLAAYIPGEHVVCFDGNMRLDAVKQIIAVMPKIQELHLFNATLSDRFLQLDPYGPLANAKLLPSLRYLHLEDINDNDWCPLIPYLAHQTSGGQVVSLRITGKPVHVCPPVVESIKDLVQEFILELTLVEGCSLCLSQEDEKRIDDDEDRWSICDLGKEHQYRPWVDDYGF
ncbi:hypothetical protein BDM02DRAFT_3128861 [Thelephora ganbajun]|uniref:Uncharacterized protein n=1 Tax=Thelephora ganbajun TaxID=370292 RepID=A0ACB6ZHC2_THEGA|nr:hypothetical protein BDM02DRAFT_3128861 [Thelephora ganbajun]